MNYKVKNILVSLAALTCLSACDGGTNSSSSVEESSSDNSVSASEEGNAALASALAKAKVSVNFSGSLTSVYVEDGDNYDEGTIDALFGGDFLEWNKVFENYYSREIEYDYPFVEDADGYLSYERVNGKNQLVTETFINHVTDEPMDFDTYATNPFSTLEASDFTLIEGRYYLSDDKLGVFAPFMDLNSLSEYHFYEFTIGQVSLSLSGESFQDIAITTNPRSDELIDPMDFFLDASFDLVFPGAVEVTHPTTKTHREEHDTLLSALTALQETIAGQNYTIHSVLGESGGEYGSEYDNYATEDGFYSEFRPAIYTYKEGYEKRDDGYYYNYLYYVVGDDAGQKRYMSETSSTYRLTRDQLEPNFLAFAPEFFLKSGSSFVCSNVSILPEIWPYVAPFIDRQYSYYVPTKVTFNLDSDNLVSSWSAVLVDDDYTDTITYTIKDIGATVIEPKTLAEESEAE